MFVYDSHQSACGESVNCSVKASQVLHILHRLAAALLVLSIPFPSAIMSYDPREHFQRIQRNLQSSGRASFGGGAGGPGGRGIAAIVLLGVVGIAANNALFNGMASANRI